MFFQISYYFVQHLWMQVGTPGTQISFLTGFVMVYTDRWQQKKLLKELPCHIPCLLCWQFYKQLRGWFADGVSGSRQWMWQKCTSRRQLPSAENRSPERHCLQPCDSMQRLQRSYADLRQLKKMWLRLPAKKQASKQRLGRARLVSHCQAARQQWEPSRLPWSSGGHRLTPISPHVVYWDSGRT